ncbi:hypothetical protein ACE38W_14765 [Chitinophaga sp. Hz27]|uniref:hypothetical protein n=1 Tax=Chitinophaga sp. Hz27 TaxID=3347169 RepID=UPI0035D547F4
MNKIKSSTQTIRVFDTFQDARKAAHDHFNSVEGDKWGSRFVSQTQVGKMIHLTFVSCKTQSTQGEFLAAISQ